MLSGVLQTAFFFIGGRPPTAAAEWCGSARCRAPAAGQGRRPSISGRPGGRGHERPPRGSRCSPPRRRSARSPRGDSRRCGTARCCARPADCIPAAARAALPRGRSPGSRPGHWSGVVVVGRPRLADEPLDVISFKVPHSAALAIKRAAEQEGESRSAFLRKAALDRAESVLAAS